MTQLLGHSHKNREYITTNPDAYKWLKQMGFIVYLELEIKNLKQA